MSTHESTPIRRLTRRERRIERMRTQRMGHAQRSTFRVSGTPLLARPGSSRPDAAIYLTGAAS